MLICRYRYDIRQLIDPHCRDSKEIQMGYAEKRRNPRLETNNFVSYYYLDENESIISEGLGKAKNISKKGLMLVTGKLVETDKILIVSTDERHNIIEMKGKVAYTRKADGGSIYTGIEFLGSSGENLQFAKSLLRVYLISKDQSSLSVNAA